MRKLSYYLFSLLMLFSFTLSSCKDDKKPEEKKTFKIADSDKELTFDAEGGEQFIAVTTNVVGWRAISDQDWCQTSETAQGVDVKIEQENKGEASRQATILLDGGKGGQVKVKVVQMPYGPTMELNSAEKRVESTGGAVEFILRTNLKYKKEYFLLEQDKTDPEVYNLKSSVSKLPSWIKKADKVRAGKMTDERFAYELEENVAVEGRGVLIRFTELEAKDPKKAKSSEIRIIQKPLADNGGGGGQTISEDVKIKIVSGQASQAQPGEGIDKAFDGKPSTIYHSPWSGTKFPIILTFNFAKVEDVDYMQYTPRSSGGNNGKFGKIELLYSTNGSSYTSMGYFDFNESSSIQKVEFDKSIKAKHIRVKVESGANGFASCAEMEFFKFSENRFDPSTIFKDELATEIKDGVTLEDIKACKDPFFRNMALLIFQKKYKTEFRLAEYKAYPNHGIQANRNKNNAYSDHENPTGIFVEEGEILNVFVGDTHGFQDLSIKVQGLYPNSSNDNWLQGYGYGGQTYQLKRGYNIVRISKKGLVYVNYYTRSLDEAETAQPIKIHFASATVNGYYDTQNPKHKGRWKELLDGAVDKYFDVIGKYAHLTFPVETYKAVSKDGDLLMDGWDKIVRNEMILLGLYKYNRVFKNHMYCNIHYGSPYMFATWGHTSYSYGTENSILNPDSFKPTGSIWGPSHEIGHMNQVRPQVKWIGMTEVTVNIMAEYITTTVFGQKSRLQKEGLGEVWSNNRYTKAWNSLLVHELPFCIASINPVKEKTKIPAKFWETKRHRNNVVRGATNGILKDVFCQLVPFWQLQLYFGNVKGMTPTEANGYDGFYPRVYEWGRTHDYLGTRPTGDQDGVYQTDFAYNVSKASGYDLTDFFVKWGFLREMPKTEIDDYAKANIYIPKSRVDEVKKRIKDLNLPKPTQPIEYITDRSVPFFKNNLKVVKGRPARVSGQDVLINGWKNVVVYEIWTKPYGTDGAVLRYVGDGCVYRNWVEQQGAKLAVCDYMPNQYLYAVQADGKRIQITVE